MTDLFVTVLSVSLSTGILAALLLALSPLVNRRYASKWRVWIWAVIALRLIIPVSGPWRNAEAPEAAPQAYEPQADYSAVQEEPRFRVDPAPAPVIEFTLPERFSEPIPAPAPQKTDSPLSNVTLLDVASVIWVIGAALALLVQLGAFYLYKRSTLKNGQRVTDGEAAEIYKKILGEMNIRRGPKLYVCKNVPSPMVMGCVNPALVLNNSEYDPEQLEFIVRHELTHFKRHDVWLKLLFTAAASVHWFNPVIWLMRRRADVDMELSVDEGVVGQSGLEVRKAYTEVLISTIGKSTGVPNALTTHFSGGKKVMKKRFYNILTKFNRKNGALLLAAVMVLAVAAGAFIGCSAGIDDFDPLEKANEAIETLKSSGDLELANEILVYEVGSDYADEVQEHEAVTLEVTRDGQSYESEFLPMKSPYDTKSSCMEALGKVFTKSACQKREEYFEESDCLRVIDGVIYYEPSEPIRYLYLFPFESAEKVSSKEIVAKTKFVWQDNSLSDCVITLKKEGGGWKIDSISDPEAARDDPECACAWPITREEAGLPEEDYSAEAEALTQKLRETVGDVEIRAFETNDFDGDGTAEAFGATGEDFDVTLWFVTEDGAEQVDSDEYVIYDGGQHLISFGADKFYTVELSFGTVSWTKIYGVKDGKWYEHEFSGKVSDLRQMRGENLLEGVDESGYDAFYDENGDDAGGHTYKTYYFFYRDGEFKEYGGIEIMPSEFMRLNGAKDILDSIDATTAGIRNIIYRGGAEIININCQTRDPEDGWTHNTYLTVRVDGMDAILLGSEFSDGVMQTAMMPEIAVYPDKFDPSEKLTASPDIIDEGTIERLVSEDLRINRLLYAESPACDFNDTKESNGKIYYGVTDPEIDEWSEWEELLRGVYAPELAEEMLNVDSLVRIGGKTYCDGGSRGYEYTDEYSCSVISSEGQLDADTNETVAEYVTVRVKNPAFDDDEPADVKDYVLVRRTGGDWLIESVAPAAPAVPASFDPEATEEALSLTLWEDYEEAAQLLHLHRRTDGEAEFDGDVYIPLAEQYDTMEKCETFLHKVFARSFCEQILRNEFGRHRLFVEHDGKMYAISGDFSGVFLCNFPIDGAVYDGENKMSVYTDIWYDGGLENADDYIFRLEKEDGSWKIASIEVVDHNDQSVYYEYTQSYYYADTAGAERAVHAWFEDEAKKDYVMNLELIDVSLDWSETYRLADMYKGSELAERRGWSDQDIEDKFYVVAAEYNAIYDQTKTALDDGHLKRYFGLMYHEDSDSWEILDGVGETVSLTSASDPSAVPQSSSESEYYPTSTFGTNTPVMAVLNNGGLDFSETDELVILSFTVPDGWHQYQSERSGGFDYDMPVFKKEDFDPDLFRIFPEGTDYPADFNANEGESDTLTVLEERTNERSEKAPYLMCRRWISHSSDGDCEYSEYIAESHGYCVRLRFIKPESAGDEFEEQCLDVLRSVEVNPPRQMELISEEDAAVNPGVPLYGYGEATEAASATETEGLLYPGAYEGTWYTVEADGVTYFYGKKNGEAAVTLYSWAITGAEHELKNGFKVGMSAEEIAESHPDMVILDLKTFEVTNGSFVDFPGFNAYAYPVKEYDRDMWVDGFDTAMIARVELPEGLPAEYLALMIKDGRVAAITFYE